MSIKVNQFFYYCNNKKIVVNNNIYVNLNINLNNVSSDISIDGKRVSNSFVRTNKGYIIMAVWDSIVHVLGGDSIWLRL